jgi:hypothetical protein
MRGYVKGRPWEYVRTEPQRITLRTADGLTKTVEHTWSGRSYSEERGCTVIDAKTGNCSSLRELADCLRRVLFHGKIPESERFRLSPEMLEALRSGGDGLTGLETKGAESGPYAWKDAAERVFPQARFHHKCGLISNITLDLAAVDDAASGRRFILVPAVALGSGSQPDGEKVLPEMARRLCEWMASRPK